MTNKKLEKILVINDDADDINSLKAVLPENIKMSSISQFEAKCRKSFNYDLIILDNDANEAKKSKGKETLKSILKKKKLGAPVIYTSHTPSWIPDEVSNDSRVNIIKTENLPKYLANIYGIPIKQVSESKPEGKTSVIITYNNVENYKSGIYGDGKLLIVSDTKRTYEKAPEVTKKNLEKIYGTFDIKNDKDKIKDIYIYVGLNAIEEPLNLAMSLAHDIRKQIYVMACSCQWDEKASRVKNTGLDVIIHQVTCGGQEDLMDVADKILGRKNGKEIKEKNKK